MSKADLKAAMESLQVRNPLRLPTRQPQFVAPTPVAEPAEVAGATQVPTETQVVARTQVVPTPQAVEATQVPGPTPVDGPTSVAMPTQVSAETPVATPAPVAPATQVAQRTQTRAGDGTPPTASDQDSSVTLEALAAPKLHNGYTRLPNNVLMRMAAGELVRSEIQVLLLIARFTISFQRRHAPLSKTVLERQSGLRGPAVLQAISALLAKGLIEKIPGDQHRPNQLGLVFTEEWDFFPKGSSGEKTWVAPATADAARTKVATETSVPTATAATVVAATPAGVPPATDFKDIKTIKNNASLSTLPEALQKYFDELKPAKKRESEGQALEGLLKDYPAEDISDCLALLQTRGVVRRGPNGEESQPCHSPMAYLSKAMAEVFLEVDRRRKKIRERAERERQEAEINCNRLEEEAREAALWDEKEQAFGRAFPSEEKQREALAEILRGLPFSTGSQAGRIMGIGRWWEAFTEAHRREN